MQRHRKVAELLMDLGLIPAADTRIGNSGQDKVLSGGEKKRLSFATEVRIEKYISRNNLNHLLL